MATRMNDGAEAQRTRRQIEQAVLDFLKHLYEAEDDDEEIFMTTHIASDPSKTLNFEKERSLRLTPNSAEAFMLQVRLLSQIHRLVSHEQHATKRDLYYESKNHYGKQFVLDRTLRSVSSFLNAPRSALNVTSCSSGTATGPLRLFNENGATVNLQDTSVSINESLMRFQSIECEFNAVLVVEKDTVFQRLIDEKFLIEHPCVLLVTGRGYPDICTRNFLSLLKDQTNASFLALLDADPHGIEILLTYKYGSISEAVNTEAGEHAHVSTILWIGLLPSELQHLPVGKDQYLPLAVLERRKMTRMAARLKSLGEYEIIEQLIELERIGHKVEIEALHSIAPGYLTSRYLRARL